jgi:hypothetical protein
LHLDIAFVIQGPDEECLAMKREKKIVCFLFTSIILSMSIIVRGICYAKEGLTPGEKGMAFLLTLNNDGLVKWSIDGPFFNVFVEPKLWKSYTHRDKELFCRHVLNTAKYLLQKGNKIAFFSIFDMTSHEKYAKGSLMDSSFKITK